MSKLTDYTAYADAQRHFSGAGLWALFDGDRERLNIAHECVDRWAAGPDRTAVRIAYGDGRTEEIGFHALSAWSSRFAHWLIGKGIAPGDRVAIMLEPSLPFYAALFGTMKAGAVAVPLFTLFGPDGVRLRVDDCAPRLLLTNAEKAASTGALDGTDTVVADDAFMAALTAFPDRFAVDTRADAMAMYQYTSGTTRDLPEAIKHTHRAVVVVANAALYGTGVRPGDRFFCPSSPAWGHGLWHGTLAPLGLGVETGTFSGRFDPALLLKAIADFGISNLSAYSEGLMGYHTPEIDRLAKEGIKFTDYYGEQSCTAGRAAFITGQNPYRTGLTKVGMPGAKLGLSEEDPTMAQAIKAQGYATGQFGKNHLGDLDG